MNIINVPIFIHLTLRPSVDKNKFYYLPSTAVATHVFYKVTSACGATGWNSASNVYVCICRFGRCIICNTVVFK